MKALRILMAAVALTILCAGAAFAGKPGAGPVIVMETNMGTIMLMLDEKKAPVSVANFLAYVDEGFYDGTIFHRVIDGFMIQGGGFDATMAQKATHAPIANEAANGLDNDRGTIAMARTMDVDSATSQFFINTVDNAFLNHKDGSSRGFGYAVFGRVIRGMDVVDKISGVVTGRSSGMQDVPREQVIITRAYRHEG
ncbi:cyclophilin family peptidyl-prolyl cis-trans isomerase [Desulfobaculum xiamenense]|uniref:Peptidyl-prolyl cis-trans isomerase n=1 Tax=Desulfobaculum xiamenense TaxID=995050 RepID=A0A846QQQ4_9BACT|nr:peptidylprolyl isomerase [Desulfobaculum xiamenense]NJB67725.1 cyclophilin family peptidyl-prolyl cis-trans isomerase [Desulfobaculum xiamenense]